MKEDLLPRRARVMSVLSVCVVDSGVRQVSALVCVLIISGAELPSINLSLD